MIKEMYKEEFAHASELTNSRISSMLKDCSSRRIDSPSNPVFQTSDGDELRWVVGAVSLGEVGTGTLSLSTVFFVGALY